VRVGVYHTPPLVTIGPSGTAGGFFIGILKEIAEKENWQLQFVRGTWQEQLRRLESGQIDLLPAIAVNSERLEKFHFLDESLITNWGQIFLPKNSTIQSLRDLNGLKIAVLESDTYLSGNQGLIAICRNFSINCILETYPTYGAVMQAIENKKVDAGLVNRLYGATEGLVYSASPSAIVLMPNDIRMAISKETQFPEQIKTTIDRHLIMMKADPLSYYHTELRSIFKQQSLGHEEKGWSIKDHLGEVVIILLGLLAIAVWVWRFKQRQQYELNTRYKRFFDGVAISLWEADTSRVLHRLNQLMNSGVDDIEAYFLTHPETLKEWIKELKVVSANPSTRRLFGVNTVEEFQSWAPHALTPPAYQVLMKAFIASSQRKRVFTGEFDLITFKRQPIRVIVSFPLSYTLEEARRVPVSMVNVTHQRQTERQLSQVIKGASLGFWDWNLVSNEYTVNEQWIEMLGLDKKTLKNRVSDFEERIHPDDERLVVPAIYDHIQSNKPYTLEFRMRHADGHWIWVQGSGAVVEKDPTTDQPIRACGTHEDISSRKHAEETLRTLMRSMVGFTGEDLFNRAVRELCQWFNADGANIGELVDGQRIVSLATIVDNNMLESHEYQLFGTPCNEVIQHGAQLYTEGVAENFPSDEALVTLKIEGYAGVPIRNLKREVIGVVWVISRSPLRLEPDWQDVMEIIAARISAEIERKQANEKLEHQATYDALTDLPNRRLLIDRLNQAQSNCRRHNHKGAIIFLDLDHFKIINDSLGHAAGDLLLTEVGKRLRNQIRDEDTASRLGGDEFVVLFSELNSDPKIAAQQASQGAGKIQSALSEPFSIQGNELHVTPSLGIVIFPMDNENSEDILKYADSAMYRAKEAGRDTVRFYLPQKQQPDAADLNLKEDLRRAIDNQELTLYFQPIVEISGEVLNMEALLRWQHPEHGLLLPDDFFSAVEDSGMAAELCRWSISHALLKGSALLEQHTNLESISVNVNAACFQQVNFVENIKLMLDQSSVMPDQLSLEVHEKTLAANIDDAAMKVDHLHRLGVRFCIDRFGTGYAAISFLRRFNLDSIKIDRKLISQIPTEIVDVRLVKTLISLANTMEIEVVAVGVEREDQLKFLHDNGCKLFQGYYFHEPKPAEAFTSNLENTVTTE
jgi:diguanylate cyclase (GGDEF)-like protein/PAS domain S-box-containing protein